MNSIKNCIRVFLCIIFCALHTVCLALIDQTAISAKENAEKAITEATSAELSKSVKMENQEEKMQLILDKAMSALQLAQGVFSTAESIIKDKKQSTESKTLATEAKNLAKKAINKSGFVLSSL